MEYLQYYEYMLWCIFQGFKKLENKKIIRHYWLEAFIISLFSKNKAFQYLLLHFCSKCLIRLAFFFRHKTYLNVVKHLIHKSCIQTGIWMKNETILLNKFIPWRKASRALDIFILFLYKYRSDFRVNLCHIKFKYFPLIF